MLSKLLQCLFVGGVLVLSACGSMGSKESYEGADLAAELQEARDAVAKTAAPTRAPEHPEESDSALKGAPSADRFYVSVHESPARDFFLGLMEGTNNNIVVHPKVSGNVTLELTSVTIQDVLRVCRDLYGYTYEYEQGIYTVYPRELTTQIFRINYPDIKRIGVSDTSVLVGQVSSSSEGGGGGSSSSESSSSLLGALMTQTDSEGNSSGDSSGSSVPGTRVQTLTQTNFWEGIRATVLAIVDEKGGNKVVVVSPQTSMAIVKAYPHELKRVREYLELAELTARQQVILEAKIIEVSLKKEFEAGINWTAISSQAGLFNNVTSAGSDIVEFDKDVGEVFASIIEIKDIQQLLQLLESQGEVKVLSSPRISTVNNQKAIIKVGSDEYFVTGISNTTTSTSSSTSDTPNVDLASFFSGIALDVTPQIADDNEVILHIHPVISEVTDQQKDFIVGDDKFSLPLAHRDIRETDSIVKAANGQVVVLGGLMKTTSSNVNNHRPFISSIPILGPILFKSKIENSEKTELVILLRPMVIENNDWSESLEVSHSRVIDIQSKFK